MEPTGRLAHNKWERNFNNCDLSFHNWDENKKKSFNLVLLHSPIEMEEFLQ